MGLPLTTKCKPYNNYLPSITLGNALAIYAVRRIVPGYAGKLFRLVNATSTPTTLDIYPTSSSNNAPNFSGLVTWLNGAGFATVDIVYDQMGSGNDATQTVAGTRPRLYATPRIRTIYSFTFDGNGGNWYFDIPAAITGNGRSVTYINVAANISTNAFGLGQLGAAWNTAGAISNLCGQGNTANAGNEAKYIMLTSTTFVNTGKHRVRSQPQLSIIASGASASSFYVDEEIDTLAVNNAGTWVGGRIGSSSVPYYFNGEHYCTIIYSGVATTADIIKLKSYLNTEFDILTGPSAQLVIPGNSIVQGTKAFGNTNNLWQAEPLFSRRIYTTNRGVFGQTLATLSTNINAYLTSQIRSNQLATNLMCWGEPSNDISVAASGSIVGVGTTFFNSYTVPNIAALKAVGWTVIIPTVLPRAWTGSGTDISQKETERVAYNTLVTSNAATYGYTVIDYAGIANLSNPGDTTYYNDGIHPTSTGYGLMAVLLASTVNSLI